MMALKQPATPKRIDAAMDAAEIGPIYRQYSNEVLRRCRRILRDEQAAEDAVQEVFFRLWRYGHSFRAADHKLGWLYRVADRCCYNELRRRRGQSRLATQPLREAAQAPPALEDRDVILRFLHRFDERVQRIALFYYVAEMTQDELAAATGWSRQTVHKKLQFLRERAAALRVGLTGEAHRAAPAALRVAK
jgi:RNA polymerase sigma-70 factor (ECF subfamily)